MYELQMIQFPVHFLGYITARGGSNKEPALSLKIRHASVGKILCFIPIRGENILNLDHAKNRAASPQLELQK